MEFSRLAGFVPDVYKRQELSSYGDHRIAMSFLVAGLSAQGETVVTDAECINTSYPGFERDLAQFL